MVNEQNEHIELSKGSTLTFSPSKCFILLKGSYLLHFSSSNQVISSWLNTDLWGGLWPRPRGRVWIPGGLTRLLRPTPCARPAPIANLRSSIASAPPNLCCSSQTSTPLPPKTKLYWYYTVSVQYSWFDLFISSLSLKLPQ